MNHKLADHRLEHRAVSELFLGQLGSRRPRPARYDVISCNAGSKYDIPRTAGEPNLSDKLVYSSGLTPTDTSSTLSARPE